MQPSFIIEVLDDEGKPVSGVKFTVDSGSKTSVETDEDGLLRVSEPEDEIKLSTEGEEDEESSESDSAKSGDEVETPVALEASNGDGDKEETEKTET